MLAFAPSHPSKKVVFADWDSEEEGQRSARGIEFRQRLKEDSKNKKMAEREARRLRNLDLATRAYAALILPENHSRLATLALDRDNRFFLIFEAIYRTVVTSPTLRHLIPAGNVGGTTIQMVDSLSRSGITFQQIQTNHPRLVNDLLLIGTIPDFQIGFLDRREGHVTSSSEDEDVHDAAQALARAPAEAPAPAGRRGRGREEEDEDVHGAAQARARAPAHAPARAGHRREGEDQQAGRRVHGRRD